MSEYLSFLGAAMHNMKPRTLGPTASEGVGVDWELMRSQVRPNFTFFIANVMITM